jgi:hypothetical protein
MQALSQEEKRRKLRELPRRAWDADARSTGGQTGLH